MTLSSPMAASHTNSQAQLRSSVWQRWSCRKRSGARRGRPSSSSPSLRSGTMEVLLPLLRVWWSWHRTQGAGGAVDGGARGGSDWRGARGWRRSEVVVVALADPLKVMLSGAPVSGKGTQCELIKAKYGVVHISAGDLLWAEIAAGTDNGKQAKEFMEKGNWFQMK